MSVNTIETELIEMNDAERRKVINIAARLMNGESKSQKHTLDEKPSRLRESAELMREHYLKDKELTVWTGLDSEDFLDA